MARQLADPHGFFTFQRRYETIPRTHGRNEHGTTICGRGGIISDDVTCLKCLDRLGLYVPIFQLRAHQLLIATAVKPPAWKPIHPNDVPICFENLVTVALDRRRA